MKHQLDISEASVYVGTYAKYNNGSLFGKWLKLSDYADKEEFFEACKELHSDEEDPEYMFQDFENIPDGLIGESWLADNIFEVLEAYADMDDDRQEAFAIWCNNTSRNLSDEDINNLISNFDDEYMGSYDSEEDFANWLVEETMELPDFMIMYFDYKAYARDLFICDYWFEDGHVFQNA
ncbi:MAG: antirestriction protein ArdA [Filimonas sp.]|nr:antirestriction protein ArdA [Filimonas sp.]